MAKELVTTVHVHGHGVYGPGDELPAEVRKLLEDNPRVWVGDESAEPDPVRPGPSETAAADSGHAERPARSTSTRARK